MNALPAAAFFRPVMRRLLGAAALLSSLSGACHPPEEKGAAAGVAQPPEVTPATRIVFDTDANNELDDQHAIAYLLWNSDRWQVAGITTNATRSGGSVEQHGAEARRVVHLAGWAGEAPVIDGANGTLVEILPHVEEASFDGKSAVEFILDQSRRSGPFIILAVGKLTNAALALARDPGLADRARLVWLGSNWPRDADEYNEANDREAVNYVLDTSIPFHIVTVRYQDSGGAARVQVGRDEILERMPGAGPQVSPVKGRHGGSFRTFGDYSVSLFQNVKEERRALFDVAAVAVLKNPDWARWTRHPAPRIEGDGWVEQPDNPRQVTFVTNFDRDAIIEDFFRTVESPVLP